MNVLIQPPESLDWFLCEKKNAFLRFGIQIPALPLANARSFHLEARWNGVIWGGISAFIGSPLPCEKYVPYEPFLMLCRATGAAELCGLWVRREARSLGLGAALMQAMMAVLRREGLSQLYACGHSRLLELYAEGGLQRDPRFAGFDYPAGYLTYCLFADLAQPQFSSAQAQRQFERAEQALLSAGVWLRQREESGDLIAQTF